MKFWDSSAVVPLIMDEPASKRLLNVLEADGGLTVWWETPVECASAIARREREDDLSLAAANAALADLQTLGSSWVEISPSLNVRSLAFRLLRTHPLRAADALQLAAALIAARQDPGALGFVCLDQRLAAAAQREGFTVTG